ncbi:FAD binding domain-containing protein [Psychromarinibacter sp. C21-152]|uniref:FAD binding domain-containing protein n=1 Tax=Psychromarinibacter sediminicola TaxID=3033385 RepID=A0AAE3NNY2_9RHOB|nr:FAD binding domain-containing protein [Psychromarinibacter sediminicola]
MAAYHRPSELTEALEILAAAPVTVAAGCTDLYPATQAKALPGDILDITAIDALRGIAREDACWRIGAATTWTDVLNADLPATFDGLKLAAREVGSVQIQNAGTVAGNLCTASPAGDGAPCLLTLDASVEVQSAHGRRVVPLSSFLIGARRVELQAGEMVTGILVPAAAGAGGGDFLKLGARKYLVISIAMAAARIDVADGAIREAALAIGACSPVATRLPALEDALRGVALAEAAARVTGEMVAPVLSPIDDIRGDAAYRVEAATELMRRLLARCAARRMEAAA